MTWKYDYKCEKCGKIFESELHGLKTCKYCGGKVNRLWKPLSVIYKSDGFYTTDSKKFDKNKEL